MQLEKARSLNTQDWPDALERQHLSGASSTYPHGEEDHQQGGGEHHLPCVCGCVSDREGESHGPSETWAREWWNGDIIWLICNNVVIIVIFCCSDLRNFIGGNISSDQTESFVLLSCLYTLPSTNALVVINWMCTVYNQWIEDTLLFNLFPLQLPFYTFTRQGKSDKFIIFWKAWKLMWDHSFKTDFIRDFMLCFFLIKYNFNLTQSTNLQTSSCAESWSLSCSCGPSWAGRRVGKYSLHGPGKWPAGTESR